MKVLILLLSLMQITVISAKEVKTIDLDGSRREITEQLSTSEVKVEWQYDTISLTCYRTEIHRQCWLVNPPCRVMCQGPYCRRACLPTRYMCRDLPVEVPFECRRQERRRVEVRYDTNHHVNLILNIQSGSNLSETIDLIATTEELRVRQINPIEYTIKPVVLDVRDEYDGDLKIINYDIRLDFTPREK